MCWDCYERSLPKLRTSNKPDPKNSLNSERDIDANGWYSNNRRTLEGDFDMEAT